MPAAPPVPIDARDVYSKMPESVRKAQVFPEIQRKDSPGAYDGNLREGKLREIDRRVGREYSRT